MIQMRFSMIRSSKARFLLFRLSLLLGALTVSMASVAQPGIISPAANATLQGTSQTFTWSSEQVAVQSYWLYVGTSPGASDIFNSGNLGAITQYNVIGIPVDGNAVYVRLWYYESDRWSYTDSIYSAALISDVDIPAIINPVDGDVIVDGSARFEWRDNNTPVKYWWLYIGTSQGNNDIYNSGQSVLKSASVTVDQLPVDGSIIHTRLWFWTTNEGWRYADTTYSTAADDGGDSECAMPVGATLEEFDFRTLNSVDPFLDRTEWLRAVYPSSAPNFMNINNDGLRLSYNADQGDGYLDNPYRAELRQTDSGPPATGTTQVYRIQFSVNELPTTLFGPLIIFQRFNDGLDYPDLAIELSSVHQFPSTAAPNSIQIVDAFGGRNERQRFVDVYLQERNELIVAIHNAVLGKYVVFLNGQELVRWSDVDTRAGAPAWLQYGIYWHGMIRDKYDQRAEQIASGEYTATMTHHRVEKYEYPSAIDFDLLKANDPNVSGFRCLDR